MKKVTVIGGGTGSFVVLSRLKEHALDLSAVVTMMDSGGSTGRLRDQLGVLPPGDLRQCLVALSEASELWRRLFLYRFEKGDLKGHNFGNIFLSALEKVCSNYNEAITLASYVLKTKGRVVPVTFEKSHVCVVYANGRKIKGEGNIDENNPERSRITKSYLEPEPNPNPIAIESLENSDVIIVGPGDLYTSIIPVFLVKNIQKTIKKSHAKIIYNLNLMTKSGQTTNYRAFDHVQDIAKYLGKMPDYVVVNNSEVPQNILQWYEDHQETVVVNDLNRENYQGKVISDDIIDRNSFIKQNGDKLTRSILRHDSEKLTGIFLKLIL